MTLSKQQLAGLYGLVQWGGETAVGLIPLLAFWLMHTYAGLKDALRYEIIRCLKGIQFVSQCTEVVDSVSQEICILTVVIAGLALLSQFKVGPHQREAKFTVLTYVLVVANLLTLLMGMGLYALYSAHIAQGADNAAFWTLMVAISASLFLSLESAILDA
jgi:hypothetical protein